MSLVLNFNSTAQVTKEKKINKTNTTILSVKSKIDKVGFIDAVFKEKLDNKYLFIYLRKAEDSPTVQSISGYKAIKINGKDEMIDFEKGVGLLSLKEDPKSLYHLVYKKESGTQIEKVLRFSKSSKGGYEKKEMPMWLSIIPPLLAIFLALLTKRVLPALFAGIWSGVLILNGFSLKTLFTSFFTVLDKYIINAFTNNGHASIIIFSSLIGGMVAIISRNGGMGGVVNWISKFARNAKSTQLATWFLGVLIFFDDYANTLIVGNTMRPVTDRFKISREKLAYIVDSTAAPIAAIAFITTWIGAELGYIKDAVANLGITENVYQLFFNSLTYSYYPYFTLIFMLLLILFGRDFGPMLKAERRARYDGILYNTADDDETGEVDDSFKALTANKNVRPKAINAILPILVVIFGTMLGMWFSSTYSFLEEFDFLTNLSKKIGDSDSYKSLLWSSLSAVLVAIFLSVFNSKMKLASVMETLIDGMKTMIPAIVILIMAWGLAQITQDLFTANYLGSLLTDNVDPRMLPGIVFCLAGLVAFSTGSSWGTMAILYPLALPIAYNLATEAGLPAEEVMSIFYNTISVVLAGAVFGDHCSPISDTTILSSLASSCNHIDHVRTQMWYAITVAVVSIISGGVMFYYQFPPMLCFLAGLAILFASVFILGRKINSKRFALKREKLGLSTEMIAINLEDYLVEKIETLKPAKSQLETLTPAKVKIENKVQISSIDSKPQKKSSLGGSKSFEEMMKGKNN